MRQNTFDYDTCAGVSITDLDKLEYSSGFEAPEKKELDQFDYGYCDDNFDQIEISSMTSNEKDEIYDW
jgi:hypothetical protein